MSTRRWLAVGVVGALAAVGLVVALARSDGGGRASVEAVDRTTTTSRRSSSTTVTSAPSDTTTTATDPSTTGSTTASLGSSTTGRGPSTTRPGPAPTAAPSTTRATGLAAARVRLTTVAGLDHPIAMAVHPGDGALWLATKGGAVCRLQGASCVSRQTVAAVSTGGEQGLLGITFNPSGSRFYASYTDPAGDTRVDEFVAGGGGLPDLGTRRTIFTEDQPEPNHNGGNVVFGPDGRLYLGLGDGGGAGDRHGTIGNAQDPGTDLGKVLRIDPGPATPTVERWISGVRNPWRFSFDRATGDLWLGDVGQNQWEEIDFLPAGAQQGRNLGWRCYEGTHPYSSCGSTSGFTPPLFEYSHAEGCSVTGGYVYRGGRIPDLVGAYLFADYCDGELRALTQAGGRVTATRRLGVDPGNVVSFGEDGAGELYVLTPSAVLRIDPA